ncbi:lysM and putative peptidoglycan-binding domain-containing protein 4 [Erpetoichthys calabaricus]|uniref:LysM and putative peptidoglycan-binding domain-containing protein 4 n=1 Tax=Erpetoichthys calabaricus TaxID=27687 RepID=A0A8C4TK88_ERPCA|nr:lysM and putative peptidoglycan-binding domain-containing protein 4 [Erpetoichthys calabaricus]
MIRLKDSLLRPFQAPVQIQTHQNSNLYLFKTEGTDSDESSEDEFNTVQLRTRSREQARDKRGELLLLERDVSDADNLNKLALQYGCKVADIKRVNNLIREQDMFALKSIKIPVKKHGLLTEANQELRDPKGATSSCVLDIDTSYSLDSDLVITDSYRPESNKCTNFFKEIDKNIERIIYSTDSAGKTDFETLSIVANNAENQTTANHGADWGIPWWNAVLLMLIIGIVFPVFYVVYFKIQENGALNSSATSPAASTVTSDVTENNFTTIIPDKALNLRKMMPSIVTRTHEKGKLPLPS